MIGDPTLEPQIPNRVKKTAQGILFVVGSLFLFGSYSAGLAQVNGVSFEYLKSLASGEAIVSPSSLRLFPIGSANLDAMQIGDGFEARAFDDAGNILANITIDARFTFIPNVGSMQESLVAGWATQNDEGKSIHTIAPDLAPGRYQIIGIKDSREPSWVTLGESGPSITVKGPIESLPDTGELRGKTEIEGTGLYVSESGGCQQEQILGGMVISYTGTQSGSVTQNQCSISTGQPVYSVPGLPIGTYQVSIAVPGGYETVGASSVSVEVRKDEQTVQIFTIKKSEVINPTPPPPVDADTGELRGKTSFGELYIRDSSGPACAEEYVLDGVEITYQGPATGKLVQNQCSATSHHPVYSKTKLPVGDYQVSITAPAGYEVVGDQTVNVKIGKDEHIVQLFSIRKVQTTVLPPENINLELKAVSPAKLDALQAGDQYSVRALKSNGQPYTDSYLDVKYIGPDTNGQEKSIEKWVDLTSGLAVINVTDNIPPGNYEIRKARIHKDNEVDEEGYIATQKTLPIIKISSHINIASIISVSSPVDFNSLTSAEQVQATILNKVYGEVPEIEPRRLRPGWYISNNVILYYEQLVKMLRQSIGSQTVVGGVTIPALNMDKFASILNIIKASSSDFGLLQFLLKEQVLSFENGEWDVGEKGKKGFSISNSSRAVQNHEYQHLLDGMDEYSKRALIDLWNKLPDKEQIVTFITLLGLGYDNAFGEFDMITEWSAFTAGKNSFFWGFYDTIKNDLSGGIAYLIDRYCTDPSVTIDSLKGILNVSYNAATQKFIIKLYDTSDSTTLIGSLTKAELLEFMGNIGSELSADYDLEDIHTLLYRFLKDYAAERGLTGSLVMRSGPKRIIYMLNGVPQNISAEEWEKLKDQVFAIYTNVFPENPKIDPIEVVRVKMAFGDIVTYDNGITLRLDQGGEILQAQNPAKVLLDVGFEVPEGTIIQNIYYAYGVENSIIYYTKNGNQYKVFYNRGDRGPTGTAILKLANSNEVLAISSDGKKYTGTIDYEDQQSTTITMSNGNTVLVFSRGGKAECNSESCQLFDNTGTQTWHIDFDGYVTNPRNGWNGNNPFDASRAQINLGFGNLLGQVSGWVRDSFTGTYHNGGYLWPDGSWSPAPTVEAIFFVHRYKAPVPPPPSPSIPPPAKRPPAEPPVYNEAISFCREITLSGNYTLDHNLVGEPRTHCFNIHDTSNVNLDCKNNSITGDIDNYGNTEDSAVLIKNVKNFSIKNCTLNLINRRKGYWGMPLEIKDSSNGAINGNTIGQSLQSKELTYVSISDTNDTTWENNYFTAGASFSNAQNTILKNNKLISQTNLDSDYSPSAIVHLYHGSNNQILNNEINGGWDGTSGSSIGSDDGILITEESGDIIRGNKISNNWDCGIETLEVIKNSEFSDNTIANAAICGIGAWYGNSWQNNRVNNNIMNNVGLMFDFLVIPYRSEQNTNNFENNTFSDNKFISQFGKDAHAFSSYFWFEPTVVAKNNTFTRNDFNASLGQPYFDPGSIAVDGGGNLCKAGTEKDFPLNCAGQTTAPTIAPTARSTEMQAPAAPSPVAPVETPPPAPTQVTAPAPTPAPVKNIIEKIVDFFKGEEPKKTPAPSPAKNPPTAADLGGQAPAPTTPPSTPESKPISPHEKTSPPPAETQIQPTAPEAVTPTPEPEQVTPPAQTEPPQESALKKVIDSMSNFFTGKQEKTTIVLKGIPGEVELPPPPTPHVDKRPSPAARIIDTITRLFKKQESTPIITPPPSPLGKGEGPESGYTISIRAKGTRAIGEFPVVMLTQGGQKLVSWTVTPDFETYTYTTTDLGEGNFQVEFTNDYFDYVEDSNLTVDWFAIGDRIYQAEDPEIYSTGHWSFLRGCSGGYKKSEILNCNGYFSFPNNPY